MANVKIYYLNEVASHLGVSVKTLYRHMRRLGLKPMKRFGRSVLTEEHVRLLGEPVCDIKPGKEV